ncbi:hypothetical protein LU631_24495 [Erwinia tracheiphila]|uniref:Uncharacterized protein n=1 Tax=Erwinia tracheiphila TaxID=65700 RepID=A0A0M2KAN4_9GAMM|nr:hypothetical protein [Erwinia tracheiphila]EOS92977.1 hypothetical protein ETR_21512 [Erwinia tracheiphila PSU-1]KKF36440.1 hypothetical protein SY86_14910 [Erwinia tracheiphila]UIA87769.1 hypothetical protein LU631_24495 [Erwinia tracheiphila]UIA96134.1 hypothetical protein LU633_22935 [Erwinia tracheiphila]
MKGLSKFITLVTACLISQVQAEKIVVSLSQEQKGGSAGRACIYVHEGKAEYVMVGPEGHCPSSVTLDTSMPETCCFFPVNDAVQQRKYVTFSLLTTF